MTNLVIVESPAKAKTIEKYLGKDYKVIASFGHIRDLPSKNGSVDPEKNFSLNYQISPKSTKHVKDLVTKAKGCKKLILAPDPDREGESIAWHVLEVLKKKKALAANVEVERVVFNSITKSAVTQAIAKPRTINMDLVNSQQARRALDYLVGFTLSPVLWKKLPGSRSAGRVQSVALRIICDREDEIEKFVTQEYWDVKLDLENSKKENFTATIFEIENQKLEKFSITNEARAKEIKKALDSKNYKISSITKKETKRRSKPPFTTSSMQQEAARKLGFTAKKTMMVAQRLYEGIAINGTSQGIITYMRTDSIEVAPEALKQSRDKIQNLYGKDYLPTSPNIFKGKVKNAQEAHESIRPTNFELEPSKIKQFLDEDQFKLYDLVWKRMIASQMSDAIFDQVIVEVTTLPNYAKAKAVGTTMKFDGFYKVYREGSDDDEDNSSSQNLPELSEGEELKLIEVNPNQHFTDPPPRFSEASLIKTLEELGIGRPSTYATIISVLQDRGYVVIEQKRFMPQARGRIVTIFLKEFFNKYVEYNYTAELEDELDVISNGKMGWQNFLKKFWDDFNAQANKITEKPFIEVVDILDKKISSLALGCDDEGNIKNSCDKCKDGKLNLKLGKFGAFIGCSNYPDCKNIIQVFQDSESDAEDDAGKKQFEARNLGADPNSGADILVKLGPYGPYLELDAKQDEEKVELTKSGKKKKPKKPKRVSIPKTIDPNTIDLKTASSLLTLPREVGDHPETGLKIVANIGPFGPYLLYDKQFFSVKEDDILTVGLDRSVELIHIISEKKKNSPKRKGGFKKSRKTKKS